MNVKRWYLIHSILFCIFVASVHVMSVDPASIQSHASCVTSMQLATVNKCVTECAQVKIIRHFQYVVMIIVFIYKSLLKCRMRARFFL